MSFVLSQRACSQSRAESNLSVPQTESQLSKKKKTISTPSASSKTAAKGKGKRLATDSLDTIIEEQEAFVLVAVAHKKMTMIVVMAMMEVMS
ncbi:hypothetical protein Cni_G19599 [Canna indica]|uniref:Uncharacterized protein n=1 Tax=Canna indica TaxID=4628 RepID=A0AAQ3KLG9_9LILI|nr:hypothetical protein Cni_G19599 [Canna indica]